MPARLRAPALFAGLMMVLMAAPSLLAQPPEGDRPRREGERPRRGLRDGEGRQGPGAMMRGRGGSLDFARIAEQMLARFDEDKDKKLDAKELATALQAMRGVMGRPGGIGPREGDSPRGPGEGDRPGFSPEAMVERMFRADANEDGKLSGDEIPERMRSNLERIDTNGDGAVDRKEAGAIFERMRGRGGRGRGPGGEGGGRPGGDNPRRPPADDKD